MLYGLIMCATFSLLAVIVMSLQKLKVVWKTITDSTYKDFLGKS